MTALRARALSVLLLSGFATVPTGAQSTTADAVFFAERGAEPRSSYGAAVAGLGDLDADGFVDFAVGAPLDDWNGKDAGQVFVYSGRNGDLLFSVAGEDRRGQFGSALSGVGDLDADGFADLAVSAPRIDAGRVLVLSGTDGSELALHTGTHRGDGFGTSLASLGDGDGDGVLELAVGSPGDDTGASGAGRVDILDLAADGILASWLGGAARDGFGEALDHAGDVDADGRADLVVGAPSADPNGEGSGSAHVFRRSTGDELRTIYGDTSGERTGTGVAGVGDVDGDGYGDVAIGAPLARRDGTARYGRVRVISGRDGSSLHTWHGDARGDRFGASLARVGDVDGDGTPDLLVGAPSATIDGTRSGAACVLSGRTGEELVTVAGAGSDHGFGAAVASAGDLDRDGVQDLLLGAPDAHGGAGRARVVPAVEVPEASVRAFGEGCAGGAFLAIEGDPVLGGELTLRVEDAAPEGTLVFAWSLGTPYAPLGLQGLDPFGRGRRPLGTAGNGVPSDCQLHLEPGSTAWLGALALAELDSAPAVLTITLPDAPHLAGRNVATQAFWVRGGPRPELETTNGLRLTLGY